MAGETSVSLDAMGLNLPYSMEAEQAVLGALIVDSSLFAKVAGMLEPKMFYYKNNGSIFEQISRLYSESGAVDFVTLLAAVQEAEIFQRRTRRKSM